jgi:CHAD domain-containing protein
MRRQPQAVTETALSLFDRSVASIERAVVAGASAEVEDVHQLRVGTKRIRAVIGLTLSIDPAFKGGGGEKMLKQLFRAAAGVRDLDVQGALASRIGAESSVPVDTTTADLESQRGKALEKFAKACSRFDIAKVMDLRARIAAALGALDERALTTIANATLAEWFRGLAHSTDEDLHEVRKRTKRAHALSWILSRATGDRPTQQLEKRLDGLQKLLGEWHDLVVAQDMSRDTGYGAEAVARAAVLEQKIRRRFRDLERRLRPDQRI